MMLILNYVQLLPWAAAELLYSEKCL